jgi:predicted dienelactone hydrolase
MAPRGTGGCFARPGGCSVRRWQRAGRFRWFCCRLARMGHIVIAADHHGNTAVEPYRAEGFLCWWERAGDLSLLLDHHLADGPFAGRIDPGRLHAAGFSLGGYTVLAALGARTDVARFLDWAAGTPFAAGPREFPDLSARIPVLLRDSAPFRAALDRQGQDWGDARLRSGFAMAPAPTVRGFSTESLAAIDRPVALVVGGADREAPAGPCADWLAAQLPAASLAHLGPEVGHYVFLDECTAFGLEAEPALCRDAPGVDRRAIHDRAAALARDLFR